MFTGINKYGKGSVVPISTVFGPVSNISSRTDLYKRILKTFIWSLFSETVSLEIHRLWGSSFYWKCLKFNAHFKNVGKNPEKLFCFWDNSIWIGYVKLSLLKEEYLSWPVNVLENSLKILHSSSIGFFQLNYVHSD